MRKDSIENYRNNIVKEGLRRSLYYSDKLRFFYDEASNFIYLKQFLKCREKFRTLKNTHLGERCFIIATGPSINKVDLSLLDNEVTFGINTIFKKNDIKWNYYVVSDRIIWDVLEEDLRHLDTTLFLAYVSARHYLKSKKQDNIYVTKGKKTLKPTHGFPSSISENVYVDSHTVVYIAIQIAYYLGFREVYLLGCDCDYSVGYFDGNILGYTDRFGNKFWPTVFRGYGICKKVFEQDGRKIINCTDGGKLEVFERKKLENVL